VSANCIAKWDATSWTPLGSGMSGGAYPEVYGLTVFNAELIGGGGFITAGDYLSAFWARWGCIPVIGDLNCDGIVDFGDINPFVLYLSNFGACQAAYPDCPPENGDINPFVALLTGGG